MMPKSSSAVRPSGSTNRLPPCRSPWKMPSTIAPSMKAIIAGAHDRLGVDAGVLHADDVVEVEAVEPLHHEHPAGDERSGAGGGRRSWSWPRSWSIAAMSSMFGGFEPEVELLDDRLGEQLDQRRRVGQRGDRDAADEVRARATPSPAGPCGRADAHGGALHLHDDLLAGAQRRGVHLGDRRRGERGLVERGEHVLEAGAEVLLDGERGRRRTARAAPGRGTS